MTLQEAIVHSGDLEDNVTVYAKRIGGSFQASSPAFLVAMEEEDEAKKTSEIAEQYCPGFEYFLEGFLIREMFEAMSGSPEYPLVNQRVTRIIDYAEHDA